MDDELRRRARAARHEIETQLDVEAELSGRPTASGHAPITTLPPRGRIVAVAGSIAAVAIAIVGGVVLFRGSDTIETSDPTAPIVATSESSPAAVPTTTGPVAATTTVPSTTTDPTATTTPVAAPTTTSTTTAPDATTSSTTTPAPSTVPPAPAIPWRTLPWEAHPIDWNCGIDDSFEECTQMLIGPDGTPVTYVPALGQLVRHSVPPVEVTLPEPFPGGSFLWHLGPDEVVYLSVLHDDRQIEGSIDAVAVTLASGDGGRELARWTNLEEVSGDSELVATRAGLVALPCCGPEIERPVPGSPVLVPWLDRDGTATGIDGPVIRTEVNFPTLTVHRDNDVPAQTRTWTFEPPSGWQPRGMPTVLPTFDGGFIAMTFDGLHRTVIRGWIDGTIEMITIDTAPESGWPILDPNGRASVSDADRLARFEPFADRTEFWSGRPEIDDGGVITLPEIDTAIDGEVAWALDPVAFGNAVAGRVAVNERRTIQYERPGESEFVVTVTTSDFFDDSVFASRLELTLTRDDDGRFRFVTGQWGQVCRPGRGHQDFSPELCV